MTKHNGHDREESERDSEMKRKKKTTWDRAKCVHHRCRIVCPRASDSFNKMLITFIWLQQLPHWISNNLFFCALGMTAVVRAFSVKCVTTQKEKKKNMKNDLFISFIHRRKFRSHPKIETPREKKCLTKMKLENVNQRGKIDISENFSNRSFKWRKKMCQF